MDNILKALYDSFHTQPSLAELEQEVEANRQQLIERLEKPERKLLLRIIDAKDSIAADLSLGSFIQGFRLAWRLANELQNYQAPEKPTSDDASTMWQESGSE